MNDSLGPFLLLHLHLRRTAGECGAQIASVDGAFGTVAARDTRRAADLARAYLELPQMMSVLYTGSAVDQSFDMYYQTCVALDKGHAGLGLRM